MGSGGRAAMVVLGAGGLVLFATRKRAAAALTGAAPPPAPRTCLTWALPSQVPKAIADRAWQILYSSAPMGSELVEEWNGDLWKFVVEIHGANDQNPHDHRGVGVRICAREADDGSD